MEEILASPRIPLATYRLQFNSKFTFAQAAEIVPYLKDLGISDCYASPILKAKPGSGHGYDVIDHSQLNPELGGEAAFAAWNAVLQRHGLGLVLDTVPNHMGIGHADNAWWMDILENGPVSIYADYFDIDWHPANPHLDNKLLVPLLGDQYGTVLENGQVHVALVDGAFALQYYEHTLPIAPETYQQILAEPLEHLTKSLGELDNAVLELRSIQTALSYLPKRTETSPERILERNREKEVIKRRIAALANSSEAVKKAIEESVTRINGKAGEPSSFDQLDRLLESQVYRLAYWRVAAEEINFRRFFDINELAALSAEIPEVMRAAHDVTFQLLASAKATGLRIDHCDGLWDPTGYFHSLQQEFVVRRTRAILGETRWTEKSEQDVLSRLAAAREQAPNSPWPLYVVTEKILGDNEPLPRDWAVYGTTGYDFLNAVNGIFVDHENAEQFDTIYARFVGGKTDLAQLVINCQKIIMLVSMASEVNSLAHQLDRLSERNRRYRDFTLNSLTFAIREIIAHLNIYRTYITESANVSMRDRMFIEQAVEEAKHRNPRTDPSIFDFIRDTILLRKIDSFTGEDREAIIEWTMKFQQVTGPVLAKGLEDTAFYIYNRLVSLNEVGGHPDAFGSTIDAFHRFNDNTNTFWPHSMLATSTHDTKRSEDVRARLNVLSELPDEWQEALSRWSEINVSKKSVVDGRPAPSRNDEYLLYQSLIGAWPIESTPESFATFRDRIAAYMEKATREAKVHTSWINPDIEYDTAVRDFVHKLLPDTKDDPFLADLADLQKRIAFCGCFNSLAQLVLKLTCPGVPDIYQGTELWDLSLVDPDNRRPVDYAKRKALLEDLKRRAADGGSGLNALVKELMDQRVDGRIKLFVLFRMLNFRRDHRTLFSLGTYVPLQATGEQSACVCAFQRVVETNSILVVVPRLIYRLTSKGTCLPLGPDVWKETRVSLPADSDCNYHNVFTGVKYTTEIIDGVPTLRVADLLESFPVAFLASSQPPNP